MSIINNLKSLFSGNQQKESSFLKMFTPTLSEPPRRSTQDWFKLYNKSPRMCPIHQIASDVGAATYGIYNKNDSKKIKIQNHAIEQLFKNPNSDKTINEYTLFYLTESYLLLPSGESFWLKERNGLGKVTELWVIPPHWVSEIPSQSKPYFTIQPLGNMQSQPIYVFPEDIVYFKRPDVENPYLRGIGRAEGIGDELETDEYMSKYAKRYFFNGAIPDMVGMMPGADEATVNRTDEVWNQKYGGFNNAHKTAWLNFDAKFQILKENAKDMDYINSRIYLADATRQFFGIPPELFGDVKNSNRSTIDSAYYLYTKNVLRKELTFICDVINRQLISDFGGNIYFEHDSVVPNDTEFELKKASEGLKNGGITVDEWRLANGWEELPNGKGQILYTPLNMIPTPLDGNAVTVNMQPQQAELPPTEPTKDIKKKLTPEQKNQMWQVFDKAAIKNEQPFINAMKKYFQKQQDKINKSISNKIVHVGGMHQIAGTNIFTEEHELLLVPKTLKDISNNPDVLINWDDEDALLVAALSPQWMNSLTEGFTVANDTYGFGISFDVLNPKFLDWVNENGLNRAQNINETTKEKLRKTLSDGIEAGEGIPKLRDRVSQIYTDAKLTRSTLIARTETVSTVNAGSFETYKSAKLTQKEWLSTSDGRTRESHISINRQVVNIDKPFSNGLMYPGDPSGSAEEVCNCRCTILPIIPE